ncbi:hypothetical protein ACFFK0_15090 [Paenibacillus chartarius]|uniref:Uncharacterized protein n=1 Tax=Paenibacillus chartarius TaxID=747481 RepID=A0ABV6DM87_9BACL
MWFTWIVEYGEPIAAFVLGVLYLILHRGIAMSQAKKTAMTLMLGAEKRAEQLILITGQDKFNWVVDKGYDMMPAALRMFISKPAFRTIVQDLFDNTVRMAKQYVEEVPGGMTAVNPAGTIPHEGTQPAGMPNSGMPPVQPIPPMAQLALPRGTEDRTVSSENGAETDQPGAAQRAQDGAPV